jgi:hypothetical protein
MKINKRHSKITYCPLEMDIVNVMYDCVPCGFWDGKHCRFLDAATGRHSRNRTPRSERRKLERLNRRLSRRRGKHLKEPVLKEKWPVVEPEGLGIADQIESGEYGIAGSLAEEALHQEPEKKEKYLLPELIKEIWDGVEPDMPDWPVGEDLNVTLEPKLSDNPALGEPLVEPFPPGFFQELGSENLLDGMPGHEPNIQGPELL